jgi:biopolymer transport protein ExbD
MDRRVSYAGAIAAIVMLLVALRADGKIVYEQREYADAAAFAKDLPKVKDDPRAVIQADKDARFQKVVDVMDVLRSAGYTDISFAVAKK